PSLGQQSRAKRVGPQAPGQRPRAKPAAPKLAPQPRLPGCAVVSFTGHRDMTSLKRPREESKAEGMADGEPVEKKAKVEGKVVLRLANGQPAATLYRCGSFLTKDEADACYEHMRDKYPWSYSKIVVYGKELEEPRLTCAHSLTGGLYKYSGRTKT